MIIPNYVTSFSIDDIVFPYVTDKPDITLPKWCTGLKGHNDGTFLVLGKPPSMKEGLDLSMTLWAYGLRGKGHIVYKKITAEEIVSEAVKQLWPYTPGKDCLF